MRKAAPRAVLPNGNPKAKTKTPAVTEAVALADIFEFGGKLLQTGDLDPAYTALWKAELPSDQLKRVLLPYCLFYHLGVAAKLSESEGRAYWKQMLEAAADDDRWPRSRERRHFLKDPCVRAVETLSSLYPSAEALVDSLLVPEPGSTVLTASVVMKRVRKLPQFGPWSAWKFADLAERLGLAAIEFADNVPLYEDPKAALVRLGGDPARRSTLRRFRRHRDRSGLVTSRK
jgi:hypothetical protein